jgi:hypothetical protein
LLPQNSLFLKASCVHFSRGNMADLMGPKVVVDRTDRKVLFDTPKKNINDITAVRSKPQQNQLFSGG